MAALFELLRNGVIHPVVIAREPLAAAKNVHARIDAGRVRPVLLGARWRDWSVIARGVVSFKAKVSDSAQQMARQRSGSTVASMAMQTQPADSAQSTVARRT